MEGSVTAALLEEYSMSRSEAVRNEIVLKNLGLVRSCALSLRNTYIKYGEVDDVVNEGVIALMDAIETYDPSRGAKFETYASLKIRGAIIDYVRKQDWVPRPVRKFARDLDNANTILYNQYDRAPTTAELAEYLQISEEKLLRGMADASNTVTLSFEELLYEDNFDDGSVTASESTDSRLMREELRTVIAGAIEGLKEKERQVITLYYYKSMKYSDIAKVIGVSESRVCQINTKAMLSLKAALEPYINGMIMNQRKLDCIGNNLTNMYTPGYKRDTIITNRFQEQMILVKHREELSGTFAQTYVDTSYTDLGQGTFEYTGTPFDVAINGDVYFNIAGYNGENMLTRNGQWELDAEGYLCLSNSGRILGENGEIYLGNKDFVIDNDGAIYQDGQLVDRLRLSYIDPEGNVDKFGANMFTSVQAGEVPEGTRYEIIQGAYERSNIDVNYEMTMMMNANRIYEASSTLAKLYDSMNQKATSLCKI